jgi:hypothetical protein
MCQTALAYYPRIKNISSVCFSGLSESTIKRVSGVQEMTGYSSFIFSLIAITILYCVESQETAKSGQNNFSVKTLYY